MQHSKKTVKLGRTQSHRDAMLANLATSLFLHEKIKTTSPKAKALKPLVDRLIATAKEDTLHAKRQVAQTIRNKSVFKKLINEIAPQMQDRSSGFSRVIKAGFRKGDNAELAVVELLLERPTEVVEKKEGRFKKLAGKIRKSSTTDDQPDKKQTQESDEQKKVEDQSPEESISEQVKAEADSEATDTEESVDSKSKKDSEEDSQT